MELFENRAKHWQKQTFLSKTSYLIRIAIFEENGWIREGIRSNFDRFQTFHFIFERNNFINEFTLMSIRKN